MGTENWLYVVGGAICSRKSSIGHSVGRLARKDFRLGCGIDRSWTQRDAEVQRVRSTGIVCTFTRGSLHGSRKTVSCRDAACCVCTQADYIRPRKSPNRHALAFYVRRTFLMILQVVRIRSSRRWNWQLFNFTICIHNRVIRLYNSVGSSIIN